MIFREIIPESTIDEAALLRSGICLAFEMACHPEEFENAKALFLVRG